MVQYAIVFPEKLTRRLSKNNCFGFSWSLLSKLAE